MCLASNTTACVGIGVEGLGFRFRRRQARVYDQITLSWMPRCLPAARHIARTLGTRGERLGRAGRGTRGERDTWQAGERASAPGRRDRHVTPPSVRRAEGEAFVPLSYCVCIALLPCLKRHTPNT